MYIHVFSLSQTFQGRYRLNHFIKLINNSLLIVQRFVGLFIHKAKDAYIKIVLDYLKKSLTIQIMFQNILLRKSTKSISGEDKYLLNVPLSHYPLSRN